AELIAIRPAAGGRAHRPPRAGRDAAGGTLHHDAPPQGGARGRRLGGGGLGRARFGVAAGGTRGNGAHGHRGAAAHLPARVLPERNVRDRR
ncbi:MAG: hypothetical protein AVDCRST_MAG89-4628, partial [uncultured Gemmatimonadetes bacterium]